MKTHEVTRAKRGLKYYKNKLTDLEYQEDRIRLERVMYQGYISDIEKGLASSKTT